MIICLIKPLLTLTYRLFGFLARLRRDESSRLLPIAKKGEAL
jgi:hypothetical protein